MRIVNYEDVWAFWLDDCCYRVARGKSLVEVPSDVSEATWEKIEEDRERLEVRHGVCIARGPWYAGDSGLVAVCEVRVARYPWAMDLLRIASDMTGEFLPGELPDALMGMLLGYSPEAIDGWLLRRRDVG